MAISEFFCLGKTTFLLYLLLYRLQRCCPTAIQLDPDYFFIFDNHGAKYSHTNDHNPRLRDCWALTDSNARVIQPCAAFLSLAKCVVQTSSPRRERWKEWLKQKMGMRIISELPTALEIGAIL